MVTSNSIGPKITRIRRLRGISPEQLAKRSGVPLRKIMIWELSDDLDQDALEKVAVGLGLSSDFIRNFDEEAFVALCIRLQVL